MKVAYHFDADSPIYQTRQTIYSVYCQSLCFRHLLQITSSDLNTKVLTGDIGVLLGCNTEYRKRIFDVLAIPPPGIWCNFPLNFSEMLDNHNIYVIMLESIHPTVRDELHERLVNDPVYLGATQVSALVKEHWDAYKEVGPKYRIVGRRIHIFVEPSDRPDYDWAWEISELKRVGFEQVELEELGLRCSLFDEYASYEHAQSVAEWTSKMGDLIGYMVEDVITRLDELDGALAEKFVAVLDRLESKSEEEYSQAALSCRRILEAFADRVYPPQKEKVSGRSVDQVHYVNRLWAYADEHLRSDRNRDLVRAELQDIGKRLDTLYALINKGVHFRFTRDEARRVILRTLMLLDDLLPLPNAAYLSPDEIRYLINIVRKESA